MTKDNSRLYWMTNEKWYRINEEKGCFELTDEAPREARKSFAKWKRPKRRSLKYRIMKWNILVYVAIKDFIAAVCDFFENRKRK